MIFGGEAMEDFQLRVAEEKRELMGKVGRLGAFIGTPKFRALDPEDSFLLVIQLRAMEHYAMILDRRLKRWGID
jgi:hypothetical protein